MRAVTLASTLFIIAAGRLHAQSACWTGTNPTCNAIAQHAHIAQAAAGMASLAGNPVPGASSTLGMRIGRIPRISVAGRITGVYMDLQSVAQEDFGESEKGLARTVNVDAALGVLSGWTLAPTVGGFGSLDLLLGAGTLTLPDEFTETGMSWGVGARLGILRESFTMPGVSLTGMYRRIGDIRYGTTSGCDVDFCSTTYTLRDNSVISGRAVVGKRLFVLGANLGVGYDRFSSQPSVLTGSIGFGSYPELQQDRFTAFGNLTWTLLILNAVLEAGYQRGGAEFTAPLPSSHDSRTGESTYYGSLAIRLAL